MMPPLHSFLLTFLISTLPVLELRAGIPWGIIREGLPWPAVAAAAAAGNFLPVIPIYLGIGHAERFLGRFAPGRRFFAWLYARTGRKAKRIEYSKFIGLVLFVGVPLPVTGAWTGTLVARLLGIPLGKTMVAVSLGIVLAAVVVTLVSLGVERGWEIVSPALTRIMLKRHVIPDM